MTGLPLEGVKVLEAGRFAAAPACGTVLADWGADVIKIEPPSGDPARGPGSAKREGAGSDEREINPRFDLHNRNRRSIAVDLATPEGREIGHELLGWADVFVSNMRPAALTHLGLDWDTAHATNPGLVYAQLNGYGVESFARNEPSYDHGAFWSFSGAADSYRGADGTPPQPAGGLGDRTAGTALAGAIAAALFQRQRTGEGRRVSTSLLATAFWMMGSDVADSLGVGHVVRAPLRTGNKYPTLNSYRTLDDRWFWLQLMVPERHWNALVGALDAPWLDEDPRFSGGNHTKLAKVAPELIAALDEIFATRTWEEWEARFREHGVWYAPVQSVEEAVASEQGLASGAFADIDDEYGARRVLNTPCTFHGTPLAHPHPSPTVGEHSASVLAELGFKDGDIAALTDRGIIGPR
ncbi:MAG TPA: CoA transferase [Acidimicrobiales bacterium]|nr:CoA transferase [Acidimicrobiales bacterium]